MLIGFCEPCAHRLCLLLESGDNTFEIDKNITKRYMQRVESVLKTCKLRWNIEVKTNIQYQSEDQTY